MYFYVWRNLSNLGMVGPPALPRPAARILPAPTNDGEGTAVAAAAAADDAASDGEPAALVDNITMSTLEEPPRRDATDGGGPAVPIDGATAETPQKGDRRDGNDLVVSNERWGEDSCPRRSSTWR
jgi:hypothetical protein